MSNVYILDTKPKFEFGGEAHFANAHMWWSGIGTSVWCDYLMNILSSPDFALRYAHSSDLPHGFNFWEIPVGAGFDDFCVGAISRRWHRRMYFAVEGITVRRVFVAEARDLMTHMGRVR